MAIIASKVTYGADPEVAILTIDGAGKREVIPAWLLTPAKKGETPQKVTKLTSVHADGVALEFNFPPTDAGHFVGTALQAFQDTIMFASNIAKAAGMGQISIETSGEVSEFAKDALQHPLALADGCDPDFCAYDKDPTNPRVRPAITESMYRFTGGHIHIGYPTEDCPPWAMARLIDLFGYLPIMLWDKQQGHRRRVFGQAGIFRAKPYGVEYRTPSSFWLSHPHAAQIFITNVHGIMLAFQKQPKLINKLFNSIKWNDIREFMNSGSAHKSGETKPLLGTIYGYAADLKMNHFTSWMDIP